MARAKQFLIILIKPSHYDDDGYVIQWARSPIPSNSLASVYSLIEDSRRRQVLGDDVDIEIDVMDETNTVIRFGRLIGRLKAADGAMVGLVGVHLATVLYARARRDRAPARRGTRRAHQCSLFLGRTFPWRDPDREGSSARMRHHPAQNPQTAQAGDEDREPNCVLPTPSVGIAHVRVPLGTAFPQIPSRLKAGQGRQERERVHRSCAVSVD